MGRATRIAARRRSGPNQCEHDRQPNRGPPVHAQVAVHQHLVAGAEQRNFGELRTSRTSHRVVNLRCHGLLPQVLDVRGVNADEESIAPLTPHIDDVGDAGVDPSLKMDLGGFGIAGQITRQDQCWDDGARPAPDGRGIRGLTSSFDGDLSLLCHGVHRAGRVRLTGGGAPPHFCQATVVSKRSARVGRLAGFGPRRIRIGELDGSPGQDRQPLEAGSPRSPRPW